MRPAFKWGSFEHRIYRDLVFGLKLTRKRAGAISYARERRPTVSSQYLRRLYNRYVKPQLAQANGLIDQIS